MENLTLRFGLQGASSIIQFDVLNSMFIDHITFENKNGKYYVGKDNSGIDLYEVVLYGKRIRRPLNWWKAYAIYNQPLHPTIVDKIEELRFIAVKDVSQQPPFLDIMPLFTINPEIKIGEDIVRVSAMYPKLGVSRDGKKVYNLFNGKLIPIQKSTLDKERDITFAYDCIKVTNTKLWKSVQSIFVHRIVALAWVNNPDWENLRYVDHIDENKYNNDASNLQWIKGSLNVLKSMEVRSDLDNFLLRNIDTGECHEISGMRQTFGFIGRCLPSLTLTPLRQGRVWIGEKGRFEIYRKNEFVKWEYEGVDPKDVKWTNTIKTLITFKSIDLLNIHTKEEKKFPSYAQACQFLDVYENQLKRRLMNNSVEKLIPIKDYLVKYDYQSWPEFKLEDLQKPKEAPVPIIVTDAFGNETEYKSKKEFAKAAGTTNHVINNALKNNREFSARGITYKVRLKQ